MTDLIIQVKEKKLTISKADQKRINNLIRTIKDKKEALPKILSQLKTEITPLLKLANYFHYTENYSKAGQLYNLILKRDPNNVNALFNKGVNFQMQKKFKYSIPYYDKVLKINPKHVTALENKGVVLYASGGFNWMKALSCFRKILKIQPNNVTALIHAGLIEMNVHGKTKVPIDMFKKVTRLEPKNAEAFYNLGIAYDLRGKFQKADKCFKKTLKINPRHKDAKEYQKDFFLRTGKTLLNRDKYQEALYYFNELLKINPEDLRALHENAYANVKLGKNQEAIRFYQKILKKKYDYLTRGALQETYIDEGEKFLEKSKYKQAMYWFDKAIKLFTDYEALYHKGKAFYEMEKYQTALSYLQRALKDYKKRVKRGHHFVDLSTAKQIKKLIKLSILMSTRKSQKI